MGAWGNQPFENDSDLDWRDGFNDHVLERLEKSIAQTEFANESRAAIEYLILMHKAGLVYLSPDAGIFKMSLRRAEELAEEFKDPEGYSFYPGVSAHDSKATIDGHVLSARNQIKYLKQVARRHKSVMDKTGVGNTGISQAKLSDAYRKLVSDTRKRGAAPKKGRT